MAVSCQPEDLMELASCLQCLSEKQVDTVSLYLLCQIAAATVCGVKSSTIRISEDPTTTVNGDYEQVSAVRFTRTDYTLMHIETFDGGLTWWIWDEGIGPISWFTSTAAAFPCTWQVGDLGAPPVPSGQYI